MAGAAIIVSLQQLKGLLGIVHFTNKMQIIPVLVSVYKQKDEVQNTTMWFSTLRMLGNWKQIFVYLFFSHFLKLNL